MDFVLNDEQQMLRDMVERFVAERYAAADRPGHQVPDAGFAADNWRLLAELGLLALPFTEESGGLAGGMAELMIVGEVLGRGVVAEPFLACVLMAAGLLERAGTVAQKERWLAPVMAGEAQLALAFAEPGERYEFAAASTRFANGRLDGAKTFVLAGTACDAFIVTAQGEDGQLGLYLVEGNAPGLSRRSYRLVDGMPALEITFSATPAQPLAGGADDLACHVDQLRVSIAAELVGLMTVLFDQTLDYLKVRRQFGTTIGSFQALQHRMADLYLALEQSRSLLYRAALLNDGSGPAARLAAKSFIAAAAIRMGEEAIQLHGGMGVTDELVIGHAHKRVLVLAQLFGDSTTEALRYVAIAA